eukprot:gene14997-biopygen10927
MHSRSDCKIVDMDWEQQAQTHLGMRMRPGHAVAVCHAAAAGCYAADAACHAAEAVCHAAEAAGRAADAACHAAVAAAEQKGRCATQQT